MPLTLTLTEGVLPAGQETVAFKRLSDAMMRLHGVQANAFMLPNITGTVHVLPAGQTFSGSEETPVVFIEWKTPAIVFADQEIRVAYAREASDIIHEMSGGHQPYEHIYFNLTHAVDGGWSVAGRAMTNAELGAAAAAGVALHAA